MILTHLSIKPADARESNVMYMHPALFRIALAAFKIQPVVVLLYALCQYWIKITTDQMNGNDNEIILHGLNETEV